MRFLTEDAKESILREWQKTRATIKDGPGCPDPDIVPWCDRINLLPGICTLQSCQGHRCDSAIEPAHLWLWLSEGAANRFDRGAAYLATDRAVIERISWHYLDDGKKIASITFYGNERDTLGSSAATIYGFLCAVAGH